MTSSGTYTFNPSIGEIGLYAYSTIGVRRPALTAEHMSDLHMGVNLMLAEWSTQQVNLWKVALGQIPLVQGTGTYPLPANCLLITSAYREIDGSSTNPLDSVVTSISRDFYSAMPNKQQQGIPIVFWHDRLIAPTVTVWPAPDGNGPYVFFYYYVSQVQDAAPLISQTADIPLPWLRAFTSGIAAELTPIYAPDKEAARRTDAQRSFDLAARFGVENAPIYISPKLSSYYR